MLRKPAASTWTRGDSLTKRRVPPFAGRASQLRHVACRRKVAYALVALGGWQAWITRTPARPSVSSQKRIFISYRRADTSGEAHAIRERFGQRYGRQRVFMDTDSIPLGEEFDKWVNQELDSTAYYAGAHRPSLPGKIENSPDRCTGGLGLARDRAWRSTAASRSFRSS